MSGRTKALSSDSHHNESISRNKPYEPFKASQTASRIADATLCKSVGNRVWGNRRILAGMVKQLEYQLQQKENAKDKGPQGNRTQVVKYCSTETLANGALRWQTLQV